MYVFDFIGSIRQSRKIISHTVLELLQNLGGFLNILCNGIFGGETKGRVCFQNLLHFLGISRQLAVKPLFQNRGGIFGAYLGSQKIGVIRASAGVIGQTTFVASGAFQGCKFVD